MLGLIWCFWVGELCVLEWFEDGGEFMLVGGSGRDVGVLLGIKKAGPKPRVEFVDLDWAS